MFKPLAAATPSDLCALSAVAAIAIAGVLLTFGAALGVTFAPAATGALALMLTGAANGVLQVSLMS